MIAETTSDDDACADSRDNIRPSIQRRATHEGSLLTQKDDALYAITPVYPDGDLVLRDVRAADDAEVTLLATGETLSWRRQGEDLVLEVPPVSAQALDVPYALVFRIAPAPAETEP